MRLYKYVKTAASITKSQAIELANQGKIKVNGIQLPLTTPIKDTDVITINDVIIKPITFKYYTYYKPKGVLSTISNDKNSYINQINLDLKLSLAGRLDKESEGLMILTNDGKFIHELMQPGKHNKEYIVTVKNIITDEFINNISKEYIIRDRKTTPFIVNKIDDYNVSLVLSEGIYHQIRTIIKMNNNSVINLKRIRIANFYLNDMKPGELREFKKGD